MQQNQQKQQKIGKYFSRYAKILKDHEHEISQVSEMQNRIEKQIDDGQIDINEKPYTPSSSIKKISRQIKSKKQKFNKELLLLSMSLSSSLYLRREQSQKSRAISTRSQKNSNVSVSMEELLQYQNKRENATKRLKQLKRQKAQIIHKRISIDRRKTQSEQQKQKEIRSRIFTQQKEKRENKLKSITERIKKLQNDRLERVNKLKNSYVYSSPALPKYIKMQQQYLQKEKKVTDEKKQKYIKIFKIKERQYNAESIKTHQQKYKEWQNNRKPRQSTSSSKNISTDFILAREKQFNLNNNNPEKLVQIKQKISRVRKFDQQTVKARQMMKQDPLIGKQFEIAKDKAKFPFKYHYLKKKKHLSDQQIYDNYYQFNFDSHPTQLGNGYLQEIKKNINLSRVSTQRKLESRRIKTESTSQQKKKNKNYLQESKKHISRNRNKDGNQVGQLIKKYGEKSKVLQILQSQSHAHHSNAIKKIEELKNVKSYNNTLKLQKQIDEQFIGSIKAKLKCLQVK